MEMAMFLVSESILSLIVYHWRAGYYPFTELKLIIYLFSSFLSIIFS